MEDWQDDDFYVWIFFNKSFQIRDENKLAQCIAHTDMNRPHIHGIHPPHLFFTGINGFKGGLYVLIQNLSFLGQGDAAGASGKEGDAKAFFQTADGFADGRLAVIQLFGGLGNIPCIGYRIKNPVETQVLFHNFPPFITCNYNRYS